MKTLYTLIFVSCYFIGCGNINSLNKEIVIVNNDPLEMSSFPPRAVLLHDVSNIALDFARINGLLSSDTIIVDIVPQPVRPVAPKYPEFARRSGKEGVVYLKVWINPFGDVKKIVAIGSSDIIFIEPAIKAILEWKFSQAIINSKAIDVSLIIPFKFKLN